MQGELDAKQADLAALEASLASTAEDKSETDDDRFAELLAKLRRVVEDDDAV